MVILCPAGRREAGMEDERRQVLAEETEDPDGSRPPPPEPISVLGPPPHRWGREPDGDPGRV